MPCLLSPLTVSCKTVLARPNQRLPDTLAVMMREGLPVTVSVSFPFGHTSFELVQVALTVPQHIHFFCLYRPPPSKRNKLTDSVFLDEIPGFLEHCNLLRGKLIILDPRSGELRMQKLKSHLVRTQNLNVLPFKPGVGQYMACLLYTSPSPRDLGQSRMPSSA